MSEVSEFENNVVAFEPICLELNIMIPDFSKAAKDASGRRANYFADTFHHSSFNKALIGNYVYFGMSFFPNGNATVNEGYLSIEFGPVRRYMLNRESYSYSCFCIMSVVNNSGEFCHSQSFGNETNVKTFKEIRFGIERFIKCSTLLNDPDEYIPKDTLTIHCHFSCQENLDFMGAKLPINNNINFLSSIELPTTFHYFEPLGTCHIDDIGGAPFTLKFETQFFKLLKKESKVFQRIEEVDIEENATESMDIPHEEINGFKRLETFVYCKRVEQITYEHIEELYDLYEIADQYEILRILDMCSKFFKLNLNVNNVVDILHLSDKHCDRSLKTAAIQFIRSFLSEVKSTRSWEHLMKERKDLVAEVLQDNIHKSSDQLRPVKIPEERIEKSAHDNVLEFSSYIN